MTSQVLINYRPHDGDAWAKRLYGSLAADLSAGRVRIGPSGMGATDDGLRARRDEVHNSDVVLAVIGPRWLEMETPDGPFLIDRADDVVRVELEAAVRAHRRIIPVLVDGAQLPADRLPPPLKPLIHCTSQTVTDDGFEEDFEQLKTTVRRALARAEAQRRMLDEPLDDEDWGVADESEHDAPAGATQTAATSPAAAKLSARSVDPAVTPAPRSAKWLVAAAVIAVVIGLIVAAQLALPTGG